MNQSQSPTRYKDLKYGIGGLIFLVIIALYAYYAISGGEEEEPSIITVDELHRHPTEYHGEEVTVVGNLEVGGYYAAIIPYPELYGTAWFVQLRGYDFPSYWDDYDVRVTGTFHYLTGLEYQNLYSYIDVESAERLS